LYILAGLATTQLLRARWSSSSASFTASMQRAHSLPRRPPCSPPRCASASALQAPCAALHTPRAPTGAAAHGACPCGAAPAMGSNCRRNCKAQLSSRCAAMDEASQKTPHVARRRSPGARRAEAGPALPATSERWSHKPVPAQRLGEKRR
jgi:hypothetical protein